MRRAHLIFALLALFTVTAAACTEDTGDRQDRAFSERAQQSYNKAQPPHEYDASQARDNLIAAHDAMAVGANSWTVQYVEGVGATFQCPSVGFPIPYGAQLTNPQKIHNSANGNLTLPQIEPYGLYPPPDVAATFANCVLPDGTIGVFYSEPALTTYLFDVTCNPKGCTIAGDAKATVKLTRRDPKTVNVQAPKPTSGTER